MSSSTTHLGWLGAGRMGAAMATRLLDAGERVTVWNRTRSKAEALRSHGAAVAEELGDLASCDVVFVMVSTPQDLEEVLTGEHGLLRSTTVPTTIVDCSTVSTATSAAMRAAATTAGAGFVAAPVSGNPHVVAEGGASIVASGPINEYERVAPLLGSIARTVVHAGEQEQSRLVKLCHNLYLGMMVQSLVEVVSLAEKGGTERAAFLEFLNGTVLASDWVRRRSDDLIAADWTPTFTTELLRKDFDLGLAAARELEVPLPVGSAVHQLIQSAIGVGLRHEDFLSLYQQQATNAGLEEAGA